MTTRKTKQRKAVAALPARKPTALLADVRELILQAREGVARAVDSGLTTLYWHVGRRVRQDILREKRAEYGEEIVAALARRLETEFGRGFGKRSPSSLTKKSSACVPSDPEVYIGTHSALLWNYPDHKTFTLDYGYVDDLHRTLRGRPGERFYVIAPVVAMAFAEDEVMRSETTYVFLKVPLSVLLRLIESKVPAALKQPAREEDVNEVIDAVGFDFISQPQVVWKAKKERRPGELFADYLLELSEFRAQTLATDSEDFQNFETFSMAMVDLDYDGDVFQLSRVFWGEDVLTAAGGLEKAERLELRIPETEFTGKQMMVSKEPLLTINNHEAWKKEVGDLLKEVLEVENTLTWGYDPRRSKYVFPLHNLNYEPEQSGVEAKREKARVPDVAFLPQDRKTTEYSTFSQTGMLAVEIQHHDLFEIEDAAKLMRLFLREKDQAIAVAWPKKRLKDLIVSRLKAAGQDQSFLSKKNLLRLQQGFGPMFRELDKEYPRISQTAKKIVPVDLTAVARQSFSESTLKEHGSIWTVREESPPYGGQELHLWEQYQRFRKQFAEHGDEASDQAKAIASRIQQVDLGKFKLPWNVHYVTHEPERKFSDLLFENADLFGAFAKMPNMGGYAFPYSYKPANAAKTHVANENFNPDFFIKLSAGHDIMVVEIKAEGDDSNRNRAKCRDGLKHFETLNERLKESGEPWRYNFYFLSPEDYTSFFAHVRNESYAGWRSGLMQELDA